MSTKKAILVVSFGTSHRGTCERNIAAIEHEIANAFPDREIRRAFTSARIIRILQTRDNLAVDCVAEALNRLEEDGFSEVVVQPTHVVCGSEYDGIVRDVRRFSGRMAVRVGAPLLSGTADYQQLAQALSGAYPACRETAVCLLGHGTAHHADSAYAALDYHFRDIGRADILVGTVEGYPDVEAVRRRLRALAPESVLLAPLMVVAGDHAANDMAGENGHSWRSILQADGYAVECVLRGLGEIPRVRAIYLEHAECAVRKA